LILWRLRVSSSLVGDHEKSAALRGFMKPPDKKLENRNLSPCSVFKHCDFQVDSIIDFTAGFGLDGIPLAFQDRLFHI